ncbi:hypothetical protein [Okibacterium endophyticum]
MGRSESACRQLRSRARRTSMPGARASRLTAANDPNSPTGSSPRSKTATSRRSKPSWPPTSRRSTTKLAHLGRVGDLHVTARERNRARRAGQRGSA